MLLALSPFVGKVKLVKLELKSWGFFPFHLRKKYTINTSGSSQACALTEISQLKEWIVWKALHH